MPVHRVPTTESVCERAIQVIEAKERIVSVVAAGPGALLVFTEAKRKPGGRETRG